jgi:starvation-inducible outer membrane lipoprotein
MLWISDDRIMTSDAGGYQYFFYEMQRKQYLQWHLTIQVLPRPSISRLDRYLITERVEFDPPSALKVG